MHNVKSVECMLEKSKASEHLGTCVISAVQSLSKNYASLKMAPLVSLTQRVYMTLRTTATVGDVLTVSYF